MHLILKNICLFLPVFCLVFAVACDQTPKETEVERFVCKYVSVDGVSEEELYENTDLHPKIELTFNLPVDPTSAFTHIKMTDNNNVSVLIQLNFAEDDSVITILPEKLRQWCPYTLNVPASLTAKNGSTLISPFTVRLTTSLDSIDKYPRITDEELLKLVQKQTFKYFWDFGHPASGMARERSTSGNTVTTGGTGFGVMAMMVAVEREFITRNAAAERIQTIVSFLKNNCTRYHGAFSHWINGQTGETLPFSQKDDAADLVETAFLMQGLLAVRQYFSEDTPAETQLREDINELWEAVEWDWFRRDGLNVLYWHWSPDYGWEMNLPVRGWNESLITYVLAASSPTHAIPKEVYDKGWAGNGEMKNGASYYGYTLPLGSQYGGPLFFAHYSFLGLNPQNLNDAYANYWEQNVNHTLINMNYCVQNPLKHTGYSADCWGLTDSDGDQGYSDHSPTKDRGVIAPKAALSSMPYTPDESMRALHFFYYKLGDRLWKQYGFIGAFNPTAGWFDDQFLAIDQGPIIVMIENHRTGLLWKLFMSCPEVQAGLTKLGFTYQ